MTALRRAAALAEDHLAGLADRGVGALTGYEDVLAALDEPLPEDGEDATDVVERLAQVIGPATVASPGPRYFGFVTGGALPAALGADWLASAWDQNGFTRTSSPAAAAVETAAERWVVEALGLPLDAAVGFTTGATMANFTGIAAARHALLERAGWDVEARRPDRRAARSGCWSASRSTPRCWSPCATRASAPAARCGSPSTTRARCAPTRCARRSQRTATAPAIVCAQAGEVNTGAFDPLAEIADAAAEHGAWVHVDGAFGLWAAASPRLRGLVRGAERCDSWAVDSHKWLNVPYDGGLAIVADREAVRGAMGVRAGYLPEQEGREPFDYVPEMSRRARGVPVYAALRSLGRSGLAELVERCCALARRAATAMEDVPGAEVLNDVVLNQVLVRFGDDDEVTRAVVAEVQSGGEAWLGGTVWRGQAAARISVSNWSTTEDDIDRLAAALAAAAAR